MTSFTDLVDTLTGAIDALAEFDDQYAIRAGLDPNQVSAWAGVREVYFGATSYPRKQARALQLARRFSLLQSNNPDKYVPTSEDLDIAQDLLETEISDFHQEVTVPIQSGDPYKVTDALDKVSIAIQNITAEQTAQTPDVSTYGVTWHDANLWVEINGAAVLNGAVYANVGLATEALLALYVVPGAISYQFPKTKGTLDGQNLVAALSEELA